MAAKKAFEQLPLAIENRQRIAGYIPRFFKSGNWAYAPFILICIAALLWIGQLTFSSTPLPIKVPVAGNAATVEFVRDQNVERQLPRDGSGGGDTGPQPVIVYRARYLATGKHLRAILEYAGVDDVPPPLSLIQRVILGDFRDFLKNQDLEIPIIFRDDRRT